MKPNDPIFDNEMPMSDNEASLAESDALLKEWDNSPIDDEAFYSAAASAMEPETVEEESQNDQEATCDPTSRKTQPFDVVSAKLTIPTLLEASAGTGKTFSIKHLVLRLIVEEKMPINQLLVVTFTRAATAELKSRIREHLSEMLGFLTWHFSESEVDQKIVEQAEAWAQNNLNQDEAIQSLRKAMETFDDASISTIHGFCQKVLTNHVFTSSGYFDREYSDSDLPLRQQVVEDFLRRALANAADDDERREIMTGADWEKKLGLLTALPEPLAPRKIDASQVHPSVLPVLEAFVHEAPKALRELKRSTGTGTYDDLLSELWWALQNDKDGSFARRIREAYRGVLIDEFQDTDPVQFEIFNQLFLQIPEGDLQGLSRALFFVGDPKQAIYSFRSADLDTYMRAKFLIRHHARLVKNFRSCPDLMNAVNAFFNHGPESAFLRDDLKYESVNTNEKVFGLFEKIDGVWQQVPAVECWTSFEGEVDATEATAVTVAVDIARLIAKGRQKVMGLATKSEHDVIGTTTVTIKHEETNEVEDVTVNLRALRPGDIAILVQKREFATEIREALAHRHVRVAMRNQDDVFKTEEADEIVRLLHAFESPANEKVMTAARTTRFIGDTLSDIVSDDESRRTQLRQYFEEGVLRWRRAGVASAFAYLFEKVNVAQRLLPLEKGEARLVNYAHILELLNEAGRQYTTPSSLLAWFEQIRTSPSESTPEARRLRLPSDANLVTIETIHSSKGLQYPIVYLPHGEKLNKGRSESQAFFKDSSPAGMQLLIGHNKFSETTALKSKRFEERVRLAYVGMTRAISHLVLVLPQKANKGKAEVTEKALQAMGLTEAPFELHKTGRENAYFMALTGKADVATVDVLMRLHQLECEQPGFVVVDIKDKLNVGMGLADTPDVPDLTKLDADTPQAIRPSWYQSSFSSISRTVTDDDMGLGWFGSKTKSAKLTGIMGFPRGTKAGDCLHHMLEVADFPQIAPDTPEANDERHRIARRMIETFLSFKDEASREEAVDAAAQMLYDVVNAEILPGIYLRDVTMSARHSEMPFFLRLREGLTTQALKAMIASFGPQYAVNGMADAELTGFLNGFIDLAFGAGGKFWILDWKSNAIANLVSAPEDFTQSVMADEMTHHRYRLQYLIYLVALRRFLKVRLGRAFNPSLIGGACYVFLRGVSAQAVREGDHIQGVVYDPVPAEWIERLDNLFS